ncbi:MAG: YpsA SLOG family protein [Chthoniobacterales bacterium]
MRIISGGQTGVDRGVLDAALSLGVACGGWCPADRSDETGSIPVRYPVAPLSHGGSLERTAENVRSADGTVIIHCGTLTGGTKATADFCTQMAKPALLLDASALTPVEAARHLGEFVREQRISVLNVAGPRASGWAEGGDFARQTLTAFLEKEVLGPTPLLSFVVPAHNEEHELPEALRALRAAAEASEKPYEVIVVDDDSTDATAVIAQSFSARLVAVKRRQIAAVRNAGAQVARGKVLFFVDADTRIAPGHVRAALAALAEGCVGGGARVDLDVRPSFWGRLCVAAFCTVYFGLGLGAGAFIFCRREAFEEVDGFDEQYFAGEEVYLSLALKKLGRFKILREPIVTSARKLRMHSPGSVLTKSVIIMLHGKRGLRDRKNLDLWYDGKRERPAL